MIKMIRKIKSQKFNIGILFLLYGVLISNLISFATKKDFSFFSEIFMSIGLFLIIDFSNIKEKKNKINITFLLILFYQFCILIWSIFSGYSFMNGTGAVIFNIFELVFSIILFYNTEWKESESFPRLFFYTSGLFSIITLFVITEGFSNLYSNITVVYSKSGELISDRLALSTGPLYLMLSLMIYKAINKKELFLKFLFFCCAILIILIVNVRRIIFISIICFIVLKLKNIKNINFKLKKNNMAIYLLGPVFVVSIFFIVYNSNDLLHEKVNSLYISTNKSIDTLIFNNDKKYGQDASAIIRYNNRQLTLREFSSYSFFEILFGKGYMYRQIDLPYLQAVTDGGLIFGIIYFIIMFILTIKYVFYKSSDDFGKLITVFAILSILNNIYTGVPYGLKLTYLILILFYDITKKKVSMRF